MEILLDSVIVIDHFNDVSDATAYLEGIEGEAAISVVTRAEVLTGFDADAREEAQFLDEFPFLRSQSPWPTSPHIYAGTTVRSCPMLSRPR